MRCISLRSASQHPSSAQRMLGFIAGLGLAVAEAPWCWCFDLCSDATAQEYWAASRGVHVHDRRSPWLQYFASVYSDTELPIPFPLHRITFFYHGVRLWYELFPSVHNPFRPCSWPVQTEQPAVPPCTQSVCAAWRAPLSPHSQGDAAASNVTVALNLMAGTSREHRRKYGLPDFHGLPATRLEHLDEMRSWMSHGLPMADGGGGGIAGGWVEVIRANVYDRGMEMGIIEEGVHTTHKHGQRTKTFWNGKEIKYESYAACFFSAVVGSGTWVDIGGAYRVGASNISSGLWLTRRPNASARMRAFTSSDVRGVPTAFVNQLGGSLVTILGRPPCANQGVRLGTCTPAEILRTGWRAQRPCTCNEGWDLLNCMGGRSHREIKLGRRGGTMVDIPARS